MPNTSSAKKALKQDRSRAVANNRQRTALKRALKVAGLESVSATVSLIDKAVKNHLLHRNTAARMKAGLSKTVGVATAKRPGAGVTAKATSKKPAAKKSAKTK